MTADSEGFLYPAADSGLCINCGLCEKVCPILNTPSRNTEVSAYAAQNKNADVRMKSSSGGVFSLMAEYIISRGGIVFGAAYTAGKVTHTGIENADGIVPPAFSCVIMNPY